MNTKELVSIIITTYRRPELLDRAITSVLNQTYPNIEVVVVDDNNPDSIERKSTEKVMEKYANNSKVMYVKQPQNQRQPAALNAGIKHSSGQYIGFLDDDDEFLPNKIEEQVKAIKGCNKNNPKIGGSFCNVYRNDTQKLIPTQYTKKRSLQNQIYPMLMEELPNLGSTALLKREIFDTIVGFNEKLIRHVDWEFFTRFFNYYSLIFLEAPLVIVNVQGARNNPKTDIYLKAKNIFFNEIDPYLKIIPAQKKRVIYRHHYFDVAISYFANKSFSKGCKILKKTLRFGLLNWNEWILLNKILIKNYIIH